RLGHAHREIGLKVRALRAAHHRIDARVLGAESFGHGRLQPRAENGARIARGGHGLGLSGQMWSKAGTAIPRIRGCVVYGAGLPIDPEREGSSMSFIEAHLRLHEEDDMAMRWLALALGLATLTTQSLASTRVAVYAIVDDVEFEPSSFEPERVWISGVFVVPVPISSGLHE